MKTSLLFFLTLFVWCSFTNAQHTFSIVAVDTATKEVGSAGASCLTGASIDVSIISGLIPGRGAINAQAWVCTSPNNINLVNGINWMSQGNNPQQVLDSLLANDACSAQNYNPAYRQYGIVDFDSSGNARSKGYTGANCDAYKNHNVGYNYSVQGNILLGQGILDSMEAGFLNTNGTLADKLMSALQGANVAGADTRCLSAGTSATSAFIRVAKPTDTNVLFLEIKLGNLPSGKEPIDSLQIRYDQWKTINSICRHPGNTALKVFPNPGNKVITFDIQNEKDFPYQIEVVNSLGAVLFHKTNIYSGKITIDAELFPKGIYFYKFASQKGKINTGKLIIE